MYKPPGGLYSEGRFNRGFFALQVWGAYIWRDLYTEGLIFRILRQLRKVVKIYRRLYGVCAPHHTNACKISQL